MNFWEEFFKFLKSVLPSIYAFFAGYSMGAKGKEKLERQNEAQKFELERIERQKAIVAKYRGMSADDIVRASVAEGERIKRGKK